MSYCLSINTNAGLVLCVASFSACYEDQPLMHASMQRFILPKDRFIAILSNGNPQTIQRVLHQINQDLTNPSSLNLHTANNLNEVTDYIAELSVNTQQALTNSNTEPQLFDANFIVSGQINNQATETFLIYKEGNFIHEPRNSPFLQIGELKFGKPILDRTIKETTDLNVAAHCALVSVDSVLRSNPSQTMSTELLVYHKNSLEVSHYLLLDEQSDFFKQTSTAWSEGVVHALDNLPRFSWEM